MRWTIGHLAPAVMRATLAVALLLSISAAASETDAPKSGEAFKVELSIDSTYLKSALRAGSVAFFVVPATLTNLSSRAQIGDVSLDSWLSSSHTVYPFSYPVLAASGGSTGNILLQPGRSYRLLISMISVAPRKSAKFRLGFRPKPKQNTYWSNYVSLPPLVKPDQ